MQKPSANSKIKISVTASVVLFCSLGIGLSGCAADSSVGAMTPTASGQPSSTKSAEKKEMEASTPFPTPSGKYVAKEEFTCANLEKRLSLSDYTLNSSFVPESGSTQERAVISGGSSCFWQDTTKTKWVSISVEKISAEDFRDFAESFGGFNTPADFGSINDSLEFISTQTNELSANILNKTYLLSVSCSKEITNETLSNYALLSEKILIGK